MFGCNQADSTRMGARDSSLDPRGEDHGERPHIPSSPTERRTGPGEAAAFDVAWGFLGTLRSTGDFFHSTEGCLADNEMGTVALDPDIPAPDDGYWYLVRGVNCGGSGSYDSMAPEQIGPRDEPIGDSTFDCRVP
jgi:hypothetical protein